MKKTEKVEIRVSPEDKAALTQMSQESGRSVSETVRGLLLNQAGTATGDKRRPSMTILQKASCTAGGAVLGAVIASGLLLSLSAAHPKPTSYFLDVTLLDASGAEVDMGSGFDEMHERSHPELHAQLLASGELQPHHVQMRELLLAAMQHGGFQGIPNEWWHFDHGNRDHDRKTFPRIY